MDYQEIRTRLTDYFKEAIRLKKERMAVAGSFSSSETDNYREGAAYGTTGFSLGLEDDPQLTPFFKWSGLQIAKGTKGYDTVRQEYERAYSGFCQHMLDYDKSLTTYEFAAVTNPASPQATTKTANKVTLRQVIDQFIEEHQGTAKIWGEKTFLDKRQFFDLLQEILGAETQITDIQAEQARQVKAAVLKFPKNRNKMQATKGRPLQEVLAMDNVEKLSTRTVNQYLQSYNSLFTWAKRQSYINTNFFEGLAIQGKRKNVDDKREAFISDQIKLMLHEITINERGLIKKDYQKWGPLIAIYSGARLNEIAQLELDDIKSENGLHYFDLNEVSDDKRLKNAASKRKVPMHSKLVELGLLQHVAQLRVAGKAKLFPDFPYSSKNGYGRNLSHWFNNTFLVKLQMKSTKLVFHSLRHSVVTDLMRSDVPEPIVKAIVGHTRAGVTQKHYFKEGYKLEQLAAALEKLDW